MLDWHITATHDASRLGEKALARSAARPGLGLGQGLGRHRARAELGEQTDPPFSSCGAKRQVAAEGQRAEEEAGEEDDGEQGGAQAGRALPPG